MQYKQAQEQLNAYRKQMYDLRAEIRKVQGQVEPVEVENYEFQSPDGTVRLTDLFGAHDTLFMIHNMGASCAYCTLWADGFNGVIDHLQNRAAFYMSTPDTTGTQQKFAKKRNWRFPMVSHGGSSFATDMGYGDAENGWQPGVSVFKKDGDKVVRVSDTAFGPGDDFCSVFNLLDLLPEGPDGWHPKFSYN